MNICFARKLKKLIEFRKMTDKVIVYGGRGGLGIVIVDAFKVCFTKFDHYNSFND